MSAHYDLYETPNPEKDSDKKPLHARIVPKGTYDKEEFLERVAHFQHLPYNVLSGALGAIIDELADSLAHGYIVELGDLGHFSTTLKCVRPVMDKKEIRSESVLFNNAYVRFSKTFKNKVAKEMTLERADSSAQKQKHSEVTSTKEERLSLLKTYLEEKGGVTRAIYQRLTGLSKVKAINELNAFAEQGSIRRCSGGRMVFYVGNAQKH